MAKDSELFRLCFGLVRHEEACSELFGRYYKHGLRHARCLLQKPQLTEEAEDIVQKSWLSLSRKKDFQHFENFQAYFFTVIKNQVREYFRRSNVRHVQNHISLEDCASNSPDDSDPLSLDEVIADKKSGKDREFMELILSLDSILITYLKPRAILAFKWWISERLSPEEIAHIFQCAKKTIERDIAEAFKIVNKYKDYLS